MFAPNGPYHTLSLLKSEHVFSKQAGDVWRSHERYAWEGLGVLDEPFEHLQAAGTTDGVRVHFEGEGAA